MASFSERYRQQVRQQDEGAVAQLPGNPLLSSTKTTMNKGRNRMASSRGGPWGRYGEPRQAAQSSKVPLREGSPKLPRRKGSFRRDKDLSTSDADDKTSYTAPMNDETMPPMSAPPQVFSSSSTLRRSIGGTSGVSRSLRSPVDFDDDNDNDNDYTAVASPLQPSNDRPMGLGRNQRRASTGAGGASSAFLEIAPVSGIARPPAFNTFGGRHRTIETSRPWMETSTNSAPITRRRTSIGGTRPCMDGCAGGMAAFDRPILRPYRQLSSEDLCIGEETDEDLSNRSMLRSGDISSRSNRSAFNTTDDLNVSIRSNRSMLRTADASNRSSRSAYTNDFSNRSYRTMDDISIRTFRTVDDFSNRSYRTATMDELGGDFSNRSAYRTSDASNRSARSVRPCDVVVEVDNESAMSPPLPSPINEEDEVSFHTACSTKEADQEQHRQQQQPPTASKEKKNSSSSAFLVRRPEPCPVNDDGEKGQEKPAKPSMDGKKLERSRPKVSKSKTWPTHLMILLSIQKLSLKKNLSFVDGNSIATTTCISDYEESDDSFSNKDVSVYEIDTSNKSSSSRQRTATKSNSPCFRNNSNKFVRTIQTTDKVMEEELRLPSI